MKPSIFKINSCVAMTFFEPMYEWVSGHLSRLSIKRIQDK